MTEKAAASMEVLVKRGSRQPGKSPSKGKGVKRMESCAVQKAVKALPRKGKSYITRTENGHTWVRRES